MDSFKLNNSEDAIVLEGYFFIRLNSIKNNTHLAKNTLKELYQFVQYN